MPKFILRNTTLTACLFMGALAVTTPAKADTLDIATCNRVLALGPDLVQADTYSACAALASRNEVREPRQVATRPQAAAAGTPRQQSGVSVTADARAGAVVLSATDCAALTGSSTARCTLTQGVLGQGVAATLVDARVGNGHGEGSLIEADVLRASDGSALVQAEAFGPGGIADVNVGGGHIASASVGSTSPGAPDVTVSVGGVSVSGDLGGLLN